MIISPIPAIDNIRWTKVSGKPVKATAVVMFNHDAPAYNVMLAKLEDGTFASVPDISKAAYLPGEWPWIDPILRGLVKLGAISKEDMEAHLRLCREMDAKRQRKSTARTLEWIAKEHGLDLSDHIAAVLGDTAQESQE